MKCDKCNTEMEKGWSAKAKWKKGELPLGFTNLFGYIPVIAWRCPQCGKLEFTTET